VQELVKPDICAGLSPISTVVAFFGGYPSRFMLAKYPYRPPFSFLKIVFSTSAGLKAALAELITGVILGVTARFLPFAPRQVSFIFIS